VDSTEKHEECISRTRERKDFSRLEIIIDQDIKNGGVKLIIPSFPFEDSNTIQDDMMVLRECSQSEIAKLPTSIK